MTHFFKKMLSFFLLISAIVIADEAEFKIDRKQIQEPISTTETAIVDNPFGDVRLRSGADAKILEVFAVIQNLEPHTPAPEIQITHKEGQVLLTVHSSQIKGKLDRADLVIYVPDGVKTKTKTVHGMIEVKGIAGDVSANSERGEIIIRSVKGHVEAENRSGSVLAELMPDATSRPENFVTRTGNITLYFWEGFNANIVLETSGEITTDYSVQIDYHPSQEPAKIARASLGNPQRQISARSKQGKISILRLLKKLPQATTR